jgi:hypothetical protein
MVKRKRKSIAASARRARERAEAETRDSAEEPTPSASASVAAAARVATRISSHDAVAVDDLPRTSERLALKRSHAEAMGAIAPSASTSASFLLATADASRLLSSIRPRVSRCSSCVESSGEIELHKESAFSSHAVQTKRNFGATVLGVQVDTPTRASAAALCRHARRTIERARAMRASADQSLELKRVLLGVQVDTPTHASAAVFCQGETLHARRTIERARAMRTSADQSLELKRVSLLQR